jgi:hypothetical protein
MAVRKLFSLALAWAMSWRASRINELAVSIKVRDSNTSNFARSWVLHVASIVIPLCHLLAVRPLPPVFFTF